MDVQHLRMALDIPEGLGALKGLSLASVLVICLTVKDGKRDWHAMGGFVSTNWCSSCVLVRSGGKNVLASISAFLHFLWWLNHLVLQGWVPVGVGSPLDLISCTCGWPIGHCPLHVQSILSSGLLWLI